MDPLMIIGARYKQAISMPTDLMKEELKPLFLNTLGGVLDWKIENA
jgi:hypothetical protein